MIPQGGTDNSEILRLHHSCPNPGNKEVRIVMINPVENLPNEQRSCRDVVEKGDLMESRRYLGATSSWMLTAQGYLECLHAV